MDNSNYSFFSIKTQFENVGDALINREMIELAAESSKVYVDLSRCPKSFTKTLNLTGDNIEVIPSSFKLFYIMIKKSLTQKSCFYFLSPGGYVGEIKGKELISKHVNATILLILSKIFKVKICHIGVSYERIEKKFMRLLTSRSKLLYKHLLRDEISQKYADLNGIKNDGVMPDLAFNIFSKTEVTSIGSNVICFSFRTDQYSNQFNDVKSFVTKLVNELPKDTNYQLFAQVERDIPNMELLVKLVNSMTNNNLVLVVSTADLSICYSFYDTCGLIVSNRLHVLLMGGSKTEHILPCISDNHNMKIKGIMESINLTNDIVNLTEYIRSEDIIEIYNNATKTKIRGYKQHLLLKNIMSNLFNNVSQ
jgi:polysaccharide pyruvyl transferase WcaK-like protein